MSQRITLLRRHAGAFFVVHLPLDTGHCSLDTFHMFSDALLDHFQHPRNAGELPGASARVEVSNPVCGDILQFAAILDDQRIREARFLCRGCAASIASASLLTELIQGRELSELDTIRPESLAQSLGGLPPASFHAAQLAVDALQSLLRQLRQKSRS
jgi:nitrogen fixation protein NifU and related proteins